MVKSPVVIVRAPLFMFIYPSSGEITMLKMCSLSIFRNLHIFGGYYSKKSAFQHICSSIFHADFTISHRFFPWELTRVNFAGRPRQVGRELHLEAERGGEPRRRTLSGGAFRKMGGRPKKATLDGSW